MWEHSTQRTLVLHLHVWRCPCKCSWQCGAARRAPPTHFHHRREFHRRTILPSHDSIFSALRGGCPGAFTHVPTPLGTPPCLPSLESRHCSLTGSTRKPVNDSQDSANEKYSATTQVKWARAAESTIATPCPAHQFSMAIDYQKEAPWPHTSVMLTVC